jgi:lysozyme
MVRTMIPGIDVSHYQGAINWAKVKAAGIQFAYIKATQGASFVDPRAVTNCWGARAAGIPFGLYHVFLANTGQAQIANWASAYAALKPDLPSWLDIEPGALTEETALQALEFLRTAMKPQDCVYCSPSTADQVLTDPGFELYGLVVAHYDVPEPRIGGAWKQAYVRGWDFWQHSAVGRIDGISEPVDLDWFWGDYGHLQSITRSANAGESEVKSTTQESTKS